MTRKTILCAALAVALGLPGAASAGSILWKFQNQIGTSDPEVSLEFYSSDRDQVWSDGALPHTLMPSDGQRTFQISCLEGEKVCYGAWRSSDTGQAWGVGMDDALGCTDCCYFCGDAPALISIQ